MRPKRLNAATQEPRYRSFDLCRELAVLAIVAGLIVWACCSVLPPFTICIGNGHGGCTKLPLATSTK